MKDYDVIVDDCELKISEIHKEIKSLQAKLSHIIKKRDNALLELNKDNLGDMEWLIKNPTIPGSEEAMQNMITSFYESEYRGVYPCGYIHDAKYKAIQKTFKFQCVSYSNEDNTEIMKSNIRHFVENFLEFLEPYQKFKSRWSDKYEKVNVVGFQFLSRESGLDYLGYDKVKDEWYHYSLRHGKTDIEYKFDNFEQALDFIFDFVKIAGEEDAEFGY